MNKPYFGDNRVILQILTIEGLLNGTAPWRAQREKEQCGQMGILFFLIN
ncbi:MAG TPA: hypothetical protein VEW28_01540 [Candidatus Kapabacteria bacterium]|nr:hypothetical protein [Candidatus Kapabacteria bacterium]